MTLERSCSSDVVDIQHEDLIVASKLAKRGLKGVASAS